MSVDSESRFLHKTHQADVPKRAGRLHNYLCRPRSRSKLLRVQLWNKNEVSESTTKLLQLEPAGIQLLLLLGGVSSNKDLLLFLLDLNTHLAGGDVRAPDLQETPPVFAPDPPPPHRGAGEPSLLTAVWLQPAGDLVSGTPHGSFIISPLRGF